MDIEYITYDEGNALLNWHELAKAIQIGHENGITAEFICKQTAEQTV